MSAAYPTSASYAGLELLATAVVVLGRGLHILYVNPAAESLFAAGGRALLGQRFGDLFSNAGAFEEKLERALAEERGFWDQNLSLKRGTHDPLDLTCIVTPVDPGGDRLLVELRQIEQRLKVEREEQLLTQHMANRELIRNLAHEIKNPLGGLRGSAQLLERELERPELREYTQVIIQESDRLQALMDRMLAPHRTPKIEALGIHEVLERVRSLVRAEFGIDIERDYDPSLPDLRADREQLIQAVLNIARNAAQAGAKKIEFRTRAIRQPTILRQRFRLALELQVLDDGPGVP